jgi:integrase
MIRKIDIAQKHVDVGEKHGVYAANRVLALLRAMFNMAGDIGFVGENPAKGIKKFPEEKRDRFLHGDELREFFTALAEEPNPLIRDFFFVCLLTGARRANVQAMAWGDVDLELALWRIPDTKSGQPIVLPLVGPVVAILQARHEGRGSAQWVFPSYGTTGHLVEPKAAWKRLVTRAGLQDVRPHDLRRSIGSWMAIGGSGLPIIGKMLGHTQQSTTQIYARLSLDPVRLAAESATAAMLEAGGVIDVESEEGGDNGKET